MDTSAERLHLDDRARRALAAGLDALTARADLPLRVRDHHRGPAGYDVFEITEEPERGGAARRYLVSAGPRETGLMILGGR